MRKSLVYHAITHGHHEIYILNGYNILIIMFNFNKIMADWLSVALCRLYHRDLWTGFRQSGIFSHRLNANHIL